MVDLAHVMLEVLEVILGSLYHLGQLVGQFFDLGGALGDLLILSVFQILKLLEISLLLLVSFDLMLDSLLFDEILDFLHFIAVFLGGLLESFSQIFNFLFLTGQIESIGASEILLLFLTIENLKSIFKLLDLILSQQSAVLLLGLIA